MASKILGDNFRGSGELSGAPQLATGVAGASWSTLGFTGFTGSLFERAADGLSLYGPSHGSGRRATLSFTPFALGTASGVAVFEWRVKANVYGAVYVGYGDSRYAKFILNLNGTANWDVVNLSSGSGTVSGIPTTGYVVLRIELGLTQTQIFCNDSLVVTAAVGWADTRTIDHAEYDAFSVNGTGLTPGATVTVADYFHAKTETTSGALGAPSSGDTTSPTMSGALTVAGVTASEYSVLWSAASDDTAVARYEYSLNGGAYTDLGNVLSIRVTGRTPGSTDEFAVRAADASGNVSAPLTATVELGVGLPEATLIADDFRGTGDLTGSPPKRLDASIRAALDALYPRATQTGLGWGVWGGSGIVRGAESGMAVSATGACTIQLPFASPTNGPAYTVDLSTGVTALELQGSVGCALGARVDVYSLLNDMSIDDVAMPGVYLQVVAGTTYYVVGSSTSSASNSFAADATVVLRIELQFSGALMVSRYYVNDVLIATYSADVTGAAPLIAASFVDVTVETLRPGARLDYLNVRARGSSGALGSPTFSTTAPTMSPPLVARLLSATSYQLLWSPATDDEAVYGYQISLNGSAFRLISYEAGATVVGRTAGTTDLIVIRAVDYAGNVSTGITTSIELPTVEFPDLPLGPGNDPSGPPFSDFWTRFNNTYEVP